jgi:hypothetical protein
MGAIHVPEPKPFSGKFKWKRLQREFKGCIPAYEINDPRTWPLITLTHLKNHLGNRSLPPPLGVAYSVEAIEALQIAQPKFKDYMESILVSQSGNHKSLCEGFLRWPFNYTSKGTLRKRIGIPKPDWELWASQHPGAHTKAIQKRSIETATVAAKSRDDTTKSQDIVGLNRATNIQETPEPEDAPTIGVTPRLKETPSSASIGAPTIPVVLEARAEGTAVNILVSTKSSEKTGSNNLSPEDAFDAIMETLAGTENPLAEKVTKLEKELYLARKHVAMYKSDAQSSRETSITMHAKFQLQANEFTREAQALHDQTKADYDASLLAVNISVKEKLDILQKRYDLDLSASKREIEDLRETLVQRTTALAAAEQGKEAADKKLVKVWEAMEKHGKRKAEDRTGGKEAKKAKIEGKGD